MPQAFESPTAILAHSVDDTVDPVRLPTRSRDKEAIVAWWNDCLGVGMIADVARRKQYGITSSSLVRGCHRLEPLQKVVYGATGWARQNRPKPFSWSPV